ncbi:unknown [Clostridium sp. CAG:568]|nr:unknown [Clostridium sp. CAG:568]
MKYTIALVARVTKMPAAAAIITFPVRLANKEIVTA